ncbi:MAG: hypothetical protein WCB57_16615 [Pseudonocardiaceae bacterium]
MAKAADVLRVDGTIPRFSNYHMLDESENEAFCSIETRAYRWECTLSADEWVEQAATFSDRCVGPPRLASRHPWVALGQSLQIPLSD